jgi:23S rRNA G2445 N2-methylase RlmL
MPANKLENFTIEIVNRRDIHGADYNPRKTTESARKKLRAGLKKYGLVQPIVVNKQTMNIVGGHQRINEMDTIIRKPDYQLSVAMINVSEKDEVGLNVFLNNQSAMGEWDITALQVIKELYPDIDYEADMGFDPRKSIFINSQDRTDIFRFKQAIKHKFGNRTFGCSCTSQDKI